MSDKICIIREPQFTVIAPQGGLNNQDCRALRGTLQDEYLQANQPLILDLSRVTHLATKAIADLLAIYQQVMHSRYLVVCGPSPRIYQLFLLTGLPRLIDIVADRASAERLLQTRLAH